MSIYAYHAKPFINTNFYFANMPKKLQKKKSATPAKKVKAKTESKNKAIKKGKIKVKLTPGKKQCKNCSDVMPIHQRVCPSCGHLHEMKKKK